MAKRSRIKLIYYAALALFGLWLIYEWRTCAFGVNMELFDQRTACVEGARVGRYD